MLDDLNELRTLHQVLSQGSLTGAARSLAVSLAVVSKRLATLEKRTGVRLVNRTTRSLSPTEEGRRLLVEVERILEAIAQGEELLVTGRDEPVGTLRISAPVSFGRRHVAPLVGRLSQLHPKLSISLALDDRLVDVAGGEVDVAVRIGGVASNSSVAMRKLADNKRVLLAAPRYLDCHGRPATPDDLTSHRFLRFDDPSEPLRLCGPNETERLVAARGRLRADSGDTVHGWCVAGLGVAVRSEMDVALDVRTGLLERILPDWHAGNAPIVALFPDRATMPRKTRVFVDAMIETMRCPGGALQPPSDG